MAGKILTVEERKALSTAAACELETIGQELLALGKAIGTGDQGTAEVRVFAYGKRVEEISNALSYMGSGANDELGEHCMGMFRRMLQHADEHLDALTVLDPTEAANG